MSDPKEGPKVILTGGGTGGHVYPALAVASAIGQLRPQADLLYIGGDRLEAKVIPAAGLAFRQIAVHGIAGDMPLGKRLRALIELAAWVPLFQSLGVLRAFRPDVVIGTGGYVSGPVLLAAMLMRIPKVALDGNRVPGWTSRLVARFADVVAVAHPEMASFFAARIRKGARIEVTGLPIRADIMLATREQGARALGLDPARTTVLLFGGSLGSRRLNEALRGALRHIAATGAPPGLQVLHVVGTRYADRDEEAPQATLAPQATVALEGISYRQLPYLEPHYADALAAADLIISRAGASTVAELTARGLPAILSPWSLASTGEQALNAEPLGRAGAAVVIPDQELTADRLAQTLLELLNDRPRLARMADAARAMGRPEAAEAVARIALELAERKT
jgi:UDP-N-acetylglucosamine--N-acetylmuramyl-(pentapeptide) pyrophosphoryl-undecaprenol N-acetylglucosamine transferase